MITDISLDKGTALELAIIISVLDFPISEMDCKIWMCNESEMPLSIIGASSLSVKQSNCSGLMLISSICRG